MVLKAHQANKWRLICDLSFPNVASVNDGILSEFCSLQYATEDNAVEIIRSLGKGTQLVKLDIKDAYRIVQVRPADYHLLGIQWRGHTYNDRALAFGFRSAPKIINAVADCITSAPACEGIRHLLHYLDDFLFLGAPHTTQGQKSLTTALQLLNRQGIPVAGHKTEDPSTSVVFPGFVIDTHTFELRLPSEKLARLQASLWNWVRK